MKARYIPSGKTFLKAAGAELVADEVRYSLINGIAKTAASETHAFGPEQPWFILLEEDGKIRAAAIRTQPHNPILSYFAGDMETIASELAQSVHKIDPLIPGVIGEKDIAQRFVRRWCAAYGMRIQEVMGQRLYRLLELKAPKFSQGGLRKANMDDEELVVSWTAAFHREAVGEEPMPNHREHCCKSIRAGSTYLWENEIPVSMADSRRPTENGISIGNVYTPVEYRNRGYATSCVAALCKELLRDYRFCALYADLSNPTSNSIYKRIGFEGYCDSVVYKFE